MPTVSLSKKATERRENIVTMCLIILSVIATTVAFYLLKPVMIPFIFSVFLYLIVIPFVDCLECKFKVPRALAITVVFMTLIISFALTTTLIGVSLQTFIKDSGLYQAKLLKLVDNLSVWAASKGLSLDLSVMREALLNLPILNWVKSVSGSVVGIVGNIALVLIFAFFLLIGYKSDVVVKKSGSRNQDHEEGFVSKAVQKRIRRYLTTKFLTSSLTALIVTLTFIIFKIQLAFMFGILTFFLNFIPNVGSIIAMVLPIPVILLQYGYSWMFLVVLGITGLTQFVVGNILDPKLMGSSLGLHPAVVLLALLFWGFIWGVPGMFLAVPITAVLKLILDLNPSTQDLADVLEGRIDWSKLLS